VLTWGELLARLRERLEVRVAVRSGGKYLIADGHPPIPIPADDEDEDVPDEWVHYIAESFGLDPAFDLQQNEPN
jgi:hypothetical protein